ncbi:MAG TPA: hypothetical protein VFG91_01690 [Woeseiaceae bacterium]|nr:hypothetical protein [Woeseiaceae bacterium]
MRVLDRDALASVVTAGRAKDLLTGTEVQLAPRTAALDVAAFGALVLSRSDD